ncbi:helix-turn-helix domain-containing protein [Acerihabitans sp. TG2]|uniref:helix-turn-helix domain-containing protein n=1 Tax=Acerihabitans sp. TG2 TaxID=3096008 RepID=UPI002B227818|nr:helix-turn-helix domain-containing protein [Acerihabitans sp. TG2]MEA9389889.1 helix-turn-helix domain-containing protein [Acerihabitans sp. TG2]
MSEYRIKTLRLAKAWSQEQLADIASVSVRTVQRIENGEQASLETLAAIASAFGVNVTDLYVGQAAPAEQEQAKAIDEQLARIRKRIESEAKFYRSLISFIITSMILLTTNWLTSHSITWSALVIGILAALLIRRGLIIFIFNRHIDKWKTDKITKLLEK